MNKLKTRAQYPKVLYRPLSLEEAKYITSGIFTKTQVENLHLRTGQVLTPAKLMKYTTHDLTYTLYHLINVVNSPAAFQVILESKVCIKKQDLAGVHQVLKGLVSPKDHAFIVNKLKQRFQAAKAAQTL